MFDKDINLNNRKLNHLRQADDIVLIKTGFENLECVLRFINLNIHNIETVNNYVYPGQVMKQIK